MKKTEQQTSILVFLSFFLYGMSFLYLALPYLAGGSPYGDDNSSHLATINYIAKSIQAGNSDLFFDQSNLGVPLFLSYQPFATSVMGLMTAIVGSPFFIFKCSVILLWVLIPISFYRGARLFGLSNIAALVLAFLSISLEETYAYGINIQNVLHKGLYTQSYGLLFLPIVLGLFFQLHFGQKPPKKRFITLVLVLTFLSHIFFGLLAGMTSLLMVFLSKNAWKERTQKSIIIYLAAIGLMSWWIIPLLSNVSHVGGLPWKTKIQQGWEVLSLWKRVFGGDLFDATRPRYLTFLVVSGLLFCLFRRKQVLERWILLGFFFCLFMLLGRTNLGKLYSWIPLHQEINVARYISGLHFFSILAVAAMVEFFVKVLPRTRKQHMLCITGLFLCVLIGGYHRIHRHHGLLRTFPQTNKHYTDLVKQLKKHQYARFYVDGTLGTGSHFHRDLLAMLANRPQGQSFGMTFHATLSTYYLEYFGTSEHAAELFGFQTFVARGKLPSSLSLNKRNVINIGSYQVIERQKKTSLFGFIRVSGKITGRYKTMRPILKKHLITYYKSGFLPELIRNKNQTQPTLFIPSTNPKKERPMQPKNKLLRESKSLSGYQATVEIKDKSQCLYLKVNYFPYWQATANQQRVKIRHIAPNFMAVCLPQGQHSVRFNYRIPWWIKFGFLVSLFTCVFLAIHLLFTRRHAQYQHGKI